MYHKQFDTIIIGAGAAGLMCAQFAGHRGQKVLILDHSQKLAEKIRISGGGRCNFTNINAAPSCYISQNQHYVTSALVKYTPYHFTELLDKYNVCYHEKTLGQLFCTDKSAAIIRLLDFLGQEAGVTRLMATTVHNLGLINGSYHIETSHGAYICEKLVIATGGLSIPATGASGFGYSIAKQFALPIVETKPALVPLKLTPQDLTNFQPLSGISLISETQIGKIAFRENSLFTHRGLSGPAILQISSYWEHGSALTINLLPTHNIQHELSEHKYSTRLLSNFLGDYFSERLAHNLCRLAHLNKQVCHLSNKEITQIKQLIHEFKLTPEGSEGYKKAEVTKGGVATMALDSKTMMAKKIEGLYFIGEVVDVTGWLGGYNFQWAWSSAYAAAASF